jgi:hypothetical protein
MRMQEKGNVVVFNDEVAAIDRGGKCQPVQLFGLQLAPRRIVRHLAVPAVGDPQDFAQRLFLSKFDDGVIKFTANHEVDILTCGETLG